MKKLALFAFGTALAVASACLGAYVPWDTLAVDPGTGANWVHVGPPALVHLHSVNAGSFDCLFDVRKNNDRTAKGMNALKFQFNGEKTGHMSSTAASGTFQIINDPKDAGQIYADILLMVAVNAPSLDASWSLTLNSDTLTADDFAYVDGTAWPTGRPSGYYGPGEPGETNQPGTDPARDEISHLEGFTKGMVSIYAFPGVNLTKTGGPLDIDYSFSSLSGDVTFSAYATMLDVNGDPVGIKHTNRSWDDVRATDDLISTFSVLAPEVDPTIPEPATLLAISTCLTVLVGYSRRRR